jgi:hypothetical protein
MNRSTHGLEGSPGFNFSTHKTISPEGNTTFKVKCTSHPELEWEGADEIDTIRTATTDMRDKVLRGEL